MQKRDELFWCPKTLISELKQHIMLGILLLSNIYVKSY
jgi:hypothetical protein